MMVIIRVGIDPGPKTLVGVTSNALQTNFYFNSLEILVFHISNALGSFIK